MKFAILASVDTRPLPGAWVVELLRCRSRGPGPYKDKIPIKNIYVVALKGLNVLITYSLF